MNLKVSDETVHEAIELALKSASDFGYKLDYSNESIQIVEKILSVISSDYKTNSREDGEVFKTAFVFAAYIIAVIERNILDKKGEWLVHDKEVGEETYPYTLKDGGTIFPVMWCMKRIVDGKQDDVWFKYRSFVLDK